MSSRVEELLAAAIDGSGTDGLDPPQSRNEKLLFALNGKLGLAPGGGVSSWNDLIDKPFYTSVEFGEVVPSQSVEFSEKNGFGMASNFLPNGTKLINGEEYTITWDGVEYKCTSFDMDGQLFLGNIGIVQGSEGTGEPFLMAISDSSSWRTIIKKAGTHTVGISGNTEVVHPIDGKYLPTFVVDATNLPTRTQEWRMLCNELDKAWNSGARILLDVYGNGETILTCVSWVYSHATFIYSRAPNLKVYCLIAMPQDGGSLKEYTIAMTEAT